MNNENTTASADGGNDDLTEIEGIGPKYASALNRFGIRTYHDLAQYDTAEELWTVLDDADIDVPLGVIELKHGEHGTWLDQARILAQQKNNASGITDSGEHDTQPPLASNASSTELEWDNSHEFTLFFDHRVDDQGVEFWRTRVYYGGTGEELEFPDIDPMSWTAWILEQARLPASAESVKQDRDEVPDGESGMTTQVSVLQSTAAIRLDIVEVQLSEHGPTSDVPEKQLQTEVRFRISGAHAEEIVAQIPEYRLELYTVDTNTGVLSFVASSRGKLRRQVLEYTKRQAFPLPQVGRYQLHCILLCLPPNKLAAYEDGPIFNIVQKQPVRVAQNGSRQKRVPLSK